MKQQVVAWAALVVSTAALVSSQAITRPVPAAPDVPAEGQKAAQALSEAFEAVADVSRPSVVQISTTRKASPRTNTRRVPIDPNNPNQPVPKEFEEMLKRFFGPDQPGIPNGPKPEKNQFGDGRATGTGSGFVYDNKGHILTNNHVVADAETITVTFYDGTELKASVVGRDADTDVAVIKVDSTDYPPLRKGQSSKLRVGEWVLAIGAPFGLSQSVTAGIISATDRVETGITEFGSFIQTDAAINPGNSGGPLVDMSGRVVGINTAILSGGGNALARGGNDGVGFSIPIDLASNLADKLIQDGKINVARLGIAMENLNPKLLKQLGLDTKLRGVMITQVFPGTPAHKAGLQENDIIVKFAGDPVPNRGSFRVKVATSDIGKPVELTYLRDGSQKIATVTLASKDQVVFEYEKNRPAAEPTKPTTAKVEFDDYGFEVQPLTPELARQLGYQADTKGLVVSSVKEGGAAESAGITEGSLITKMINNQKIQAVGSLEEFQKLAATKDEIAIFVQLPSSGGTPGPGRFVTLTKPKK